MNEERVLEIKLRALEAMTPLSLLFVANFADREVDRMAFRAALTLLAESIVPSTATEYAETVMATHDLRRELE